MYLRKRNDSENKSFYLPLAKLRKYNFPMPKTKRLPASLGVKLDQAILASKSDIMAI